MLSFKDTFNYYAAQDLNPKIDKVVLFPLFLQYHWSQPKMNITTPWKRPLLHCLNIFTTSCLLTKDSRMYAKIDSYNLKLKSDHAFKPAEYHTVMAQEKAGGSVQKWQLRDENMSNHNSGLMPLGLALIRKWCQRSCTDWLCHRANATSNSLAGKGCPTCVRVFVLLEGFEYG